MFMNSKSKHLVNLNNFWEMPTQIQYSTKLFIWHCYFHSACEHLSIWHSQNFCHIL